jgi:hypothetical protein
MTEATKQKLRWALRGAELLVGIALLAVLVELLLIYYNPTEEMIDIRFKDRQQAAQGNGLPPVPPSRNPDQLPGAVAVKEQPAPRNPFEGVNPRQLLAFENLRKRANNAFDGNASRSDGGTASGASGRSQPFYQPVTQGMSFGGGGTNSSGTNSVSGPPNTNDTNNATGAPMPRNNADELADARRRAGHDMFRLAIP